MTDPHEPRSDPTSPTGVNSPALYSLFCGVIAVPTAFLGIGALFGLAAVILGKRGLERAYAGEGRREMAIGGLALGMIAILLVAGWVISQLTD